MILKAILKSVSPNILCIQQIIDIKIEQLYPGLSWSLVEQRKYFKYDTGAWLERDNIFHSLSRL